MAFTPRTFIEILNDMIAYVQTRTAVSDFTPGSVIRTILEAAALEDDEQYFQMVQLLDLFSINTSTGGDLDRRLADYGLFREKAKTAFGKVRFADTTVKTTQVAVDALATSLSLTVFDSTGFPTSGFPYTIRVGEGEATAQDVLVTANNTAGGLFTLSVSTPLNNTIEVGARVNLVTGAVSRSIVAGTQVEAPATVSSSTKVYSTQENASIIAGNYFSNEVLVRASVSGELGNTGVNTISKFSSGPPFTGASVTNTTPIAKGIEVESDKVFRERALNQLQSLSRGTPLALRSNSIGVEDPETGQRVDSANIVEDFVRDEVVVYIDDGTGFEPDVAFTGGSNLFVAALAADPTIEVEDGSTFPSSGTILISADGANAAELISYVSKSNNTLTLESGGLANAHGVTALVNVVDVITESAETNQRRFNTQSFPIRLGTEVVSKKTPVGVWTTLTRDVDYILNHGTGELQIVDPNGLTAGTQLVASYTYYTNLAAQVQKVLEGDEDDALNFPGVKAAGIFLRVEAPQVSRFNTRVVLTAEENFLEDDLVDPVRRAIEDYINSRKIGQDVIINKMIDVAYNVDGVKDVKILEPLANVIILEFQKPVAFDEFGNSLVTVT